MPHWSETEEARQFIVSSFKRLGLPEVYKGDIKEGEYTNTQIVEMLDSRVQLTAALRVFSVLSDVSEVPKRSILCTAIDLYISLQKPEV